MKCLSLQLLLHLDVIKSFELFKLNVVSFAQSYASQCLEFHCYKTLAIARKSVSIQGTLRCLLAGYLLLQVSQVSVPPLFELASFQVSFH